MTLHIYAPRFNPAIRPLDELDVYTVPSSTVRAMTQIPMHLKLHLNLFAGQLYFEERSEYLDFCDMLRLSSQRASEGVEIAPDGFILSWSPRIPHQTNGLKLAPYSLAEKSTLTKSPVKFLKEFLMKARRDCQPIEKTDLGRLLDGELLTDKVFSRGNVSQGTSDLDSDGIDGS